MMHRAGRPDRLVSTVFLAECFMVLCGVATYLATGMNAATRLLTTLAGAASILFVVCHGWRTLGGWRTAALLALAATAGFLAELVSVNGHSLFGGAYHYPPGRWHGMIGGVPLAAAVFWAVFIYAGHAVVNAFQAFSRPSGTGGSGASPLSKLMLVPLLAAADAGVVTTMDLYMDPITTLRGNWVWADGGAYFGVPVGNFMGWFAVSFVVCAIFRASGCFQSGAPRTAGGFVHLTAGLSYLLLAVMFTVYSCSIRRFDIALAGLAAMGPVSLLLPVCFFTSRSA
ncbi:MAG: carotenoid biosynthesis protein [Lentisphaeria bacterium]